MSARAPAAALALCAALAAGAEPPPEEPESPWTVVSTGKLLVRTRSRPGTPVKEIWASGVLAAPADAIQETLLDGESFPRFMPYVQQVRKLDVPTQDGSWFTFQRVAPPLVAPRDTVFHVWLVESLAPDGTGTFRNRWEAAPGIVPDMPGAVRTLISSGSWEVKPLESGGGSRAVYRFLVDPGGGVPTWLADMANRSGIPDVFKALEKEARRRAAEPKRAPARPKAPPAGDDGVAEAGAQDGGAPPPASTPASP